MTVRMDSKERSLAVFRGEVPDRAPVCDFGNSAMLSYTGHTVRECREDPTLITEIMRRWVADTGADLFFGPLETKGIFMDLPGVEIKLPENEPGSLKNAYYNSPEDVDSKPLYDPFDEKDSPMFHRYVIEALAAVGRGCEGAMAPAWCEGPLTVASYLRGAESLLMDMLMAPDEAKRVIAKGDALCRDIVSAELESFDADYVVCTDPVSSASMIDDSMFREYNMGNLISIVSHLKNRYDAPTMVHICGDTGPMLADFAKVGAAAFSLDHAVDMRAAKEALGGRSAIVGNIDPVSVIMSGTAEDVRRESQRCFDEAGAGGGFIIGPGCAVPYGTPIENIRAMVEVSEANPY